MLTYYSNSTIKCRVHKKLNHISGCLEIINDSCTHLKGLLFLLVQIFKEFQLLLLSIDYLY